MSYAAEQSVIGALLLRPESLAKVSDWLEASDFAENRHEAIYAGIVAMVGAGQPVDVLTVAERVGHDGYLIELASNTPSAANIVAYAELVKEASTLRLINGIAARAASKASDPQGATAGEIAAGLAHDMMQLRGDARHGGLIAQPDTLLAWFDDLTARYSRDSDMTGLPYPWGKVNELTHGMQDGELIVIAARPSMGKSVAAFQIAQINALRGKRAAVFSLEMSLQQVNRRMVSSIARVPHDALLSPKRAREEHWPRITAAVAKLRDSRMIIDDAAGLFIEQIEARARRAHMQAPLDLLVIDHMHDVQLPGKRDARFEVGNIAARGKAMAKEFGCPVILVAQLNRAAASRADKKPDLPDLRESGEIEQKADVVWFLHRDDYYHRKEKDYQPNRSVELILGKGRDLNVSGPIYLREDFSYMTLQDWQGDAPAEQVGHCTDDFDSWSAAE